MQRVVLFLTLLLAAACATRVLVRTEYVVTPYTAALPLDTADTNFKHVLGATMCDLNNQPYMVVRLGLTAEATMWVRAHETIHARQMREAEGGCKGFAAHYTDEEDFRIATELEAYCDVYILQRLTGSVVSPTLEQIPQMMLDYYGLDATWKLDDIRKRMTCLPH